jgi:2-oxo-4-hydroxy-4-carboxy-5-ureidoimidazoline decarboxylase
MSLSDTTVGPRPIGWLNGLDDESAVAELRTCCSADAWVRGVVDARPYDSRADLLDTSDQLVAGFDHTALAEALAAHARIGERRAGDSREDAWSREEQEAALAAGTDVKTLLEHGNREYERRFGRVFLVRAAGRSPEEMYDALRARLGNDEETERAVVLRELAEIVRLRLERLVSA